MFATVLSPPAFGTITAVFALLVELTVPHKSIVPVKDEAVISGILSISTELALVYFVILHIKVVLFGPPCFILKYWYVPPFDTSLDANPPEEVTVLLPAVIDIPEIVFFASSTLIL